MWNDVSVLPRDAAVNTVFFNDVGVTSDPDNIAQDVAQLYSDNLGTSPKITVNVYEARATPPRSPEATHTIQPATIGPGNAYPREVALCLSFYGAHNRPRERGRIYIPLYLQQGTNLAARPSPGTRSRILAFATAPNSSFPDVGGADVEWCVYSRTTGQVHPVTAGWVDDEWDTVRSRGLRATTRDTFTREG